MSSASLHAAPLELHAKKSSWWARVLSLVLSFEMLMVLFLNAGQFKTEPLLAWIPVDLTALLFVLGVTTAGYLIWIGRIQFRRSSILVSCLTLLFTSYYALTLAWSPGWDYASIKAAYVLLLVSWSALGIAIVVTPDPVRRERFMNLLLGIAAIFAVRAVFTPADESGFIAVGANYLSLGQMIGLGVVVIIYKLLRDGLWRKSSFVHLPILFLFVYILLAAGGKGPLLATVVATLAMIVVHLVTTLSWLSYAKLSVFMLLLLGLVASLVALRSVDTPNYGIFTTLARFESLIDGSNPLSLSSRTSRYQQSFEMWQSKPFLGSGIGSWPILARLGDERDYPHNIFLEVAVEMGLVGLFLLIILLTFAAINFIFSSQHERIVWLALFLSVFISAQFSGDISDNRLVFGMIALSAGLLHAPEVAADA